MKKKLLAIAFSFLAACALTGSRTVAQTLDFGDQGDGTYKNPVLMADYSDPDVIRMGDKFYMVASDFHFMGMQVLESTDLVNWKIISQVFSRLDYPGWNSNSHYGGGSWAPSIRYHDGKFWVYFCTIDEGLFMSNATDPHGPWTPLWCVKRIPKWEDPCPFWDDDGQAYLGHSVHRAGPIILHKMSADGKYLLDEGDTIYKGPVAEGTKFMKRNGWYYLNIPEGGVEKGWQTCLRARNIYGPYERRIVLEQGSTDVNGPHQGAVVDDEKGNWWFVHFQSLPVIGRVVHLEPARWADNWLIIGVDRDHNGIGEPVKQWKKPNKTATPHLPQTDDDFDHSLGLQWQWCHNPHDNYWNLSERKGWLTLRAEPADSLKSSHNMLTQKTMGYKSVAITCLDTRHVGGASAGLLCTGKKFIGAGVSNGCLYMEIGGNRTVMGKVRPGLVWLKLDVDVSANKFQYAYSTDGKRFKKLGLPFSMQTGYWKGVRVGLYCYGTSGKAQFDYFRYKILR